MKRKREVIASDAMTTLFRTTTEFESGREFAQHIATSAPTLPENLASLKEWVNSELQKSGWPPIGEKVWFDRDGKWQLNIPGATSIDPDLSGAWSEIFIRDRAKPLSRDYFLALIALEVRHIEYIPAEAPNREGLIFIGALRIGQDMRELELRRAVLPAATKGRQVLENSGAALQAANRQRKDEKQERVRLWQEEADKEWAKHPRRGALHVAGVVRKNLKIEDTVDTIRRCIKKAGGPS
jgi:hypothetical protein